MSLLPTNKIMGFYHRLVTFVFLVLNILFCNAQHSPFPDSINFKIDHSLNDSAKVLCLNELSWEYRNNQPANALVYANKALAIAEKIGFKAGLATSLSRIAEIERIQGHYLQAIITINRSLQIEEELNNSNGVARAYEHLTLLYTNSNQIEKAFEAGQKCIELCKKNKNLPELANAYDRQAIVLRYKGRFDESLDLIYGGLKIREELKDSSNMIYSYMNLANIYSRLLNNTKALDYNSKAIKLAVQFNDQSNLAKIYTNISEVYYHQKQIHLAIDYNFKSIEIKKSLKQDRTIDTNYDNLGLYYSELGEYDKAIQFYHRCIELIERIGEKRDLSTVYTNIGNLYFSKKQYSLALSFFKKGLKNSETLNNRLNILELYQNIYKSYSIMGKLDSAIFFNNKYIAIRDSFDTTYRKAMNLQEAYQNELQKNQLLQKDNQINEIKLKRRNILIVSLSVGMILLILLFFVLSRSYRLKQRTLLAEKNNEIKEQQISRLLKDQELKSMSAMLEGQDGERKRIAQDLHDRLGSILSMVKLHFKSVEENIQALRENNLVMYSKANNLLDDACEEVRKIANDLNSGVLNKFGLIPALKSLQESITATGQLNLGVLDFGFDDNRLEYAIEINLYRIIQELISNILKHSKASEVSIQLLKKETRLNIVVEDNGLGFDVNQIKHKKGMGLKNIESRVEMLNGKFNIDSGKGAGTTITIDIPLKSTK